MTDQLTESLPVEDTTTDTSDQETTTTESAPAGEQQAAKTQQSIPYSRFREVTQQNRELKTQMQELMSRMDEIAKTNPKGVNGDSVNKQKEAQAARFRESYNKADELYEDFLTNLPRDDRFTDMLLEALEQKGEKAEDWAFNLLLKKQERSAKLSEIETQKAIQRNTEILRSLEESAFADDPDGYKEFLAFANDAVNDKEHPYKGELDDLYAIFRKGYKRADEAKETVKKIAKTSKSTAKQAPKIDISRMSWDEIVKATANQ